MTITRKIKIANLFFSFVSAHCASYRKVGSKLRGKGVCLPLVGTEPKSLEFFLCCTFFFLPIWKKEKTNFTLFYSNACIKMFYINFHKNVVIDEDFQILMRGNGGQPFAKYSNYTFVLLVARV